MGGSPPIARKAESLSAAGDYETGRRTPIPNNVDALRRVIEEAGIKFVFDEEGKPAGILLRDARIAGAFSGSSGLPDER